MVDFKRFIEYRRVGKAFINDYQLSQAGHIENLSTEDAKIGKAYLGQAAPFLDGTSFPKGLNIVVDFGSCEAELTFVDPNDIFDFLVSYGVKKPGDLVGKPVKTYNIRTALVGLEPIIM